MGLNSDDIECFMIAIMYELVTNMTIDDTSIEMEFRRMFTTSRVQCANPGGGGRGGGGGGGGGGGEGGEEGGGLGVPEGGGDEGGGSRGLGLPPFGLGVLRSSRRPFDPGL